MIDTCNNKEEFQKCYDELKKQVAKQYIVYGSLDVGWEAASVTLDWWTGLNP